MPGVGLSENPVDVASLRGINVREFDWQPLIKDLHSETDPLAAKIPADQHAVFFPNLAAAAAMREQFRSHGTVVLRLAEPRSRTPPPSLAMNDNWAYRSMPPLNCWDRCWSKAWAHGVRPLLPMGTDLAILLETSAPDQLATLLLARI